MLSKFLFRPLQQLMSAHRAPAPHGRLLILHEGVTPTLHYFLGAFMARAGGLDVQLLDTSLPPQAGVAPAPGDKVVIIRFISPLWQSFLTTHLQDVRVVWFMDDDLLDAEAMQALPKDYRRRLLRRGRLQQPWLTRFCHRVWVSSPYLAEKYAHLQPVIVLPQAQAPLLEQADTVRIAYHGTASHHQEKLWLREVMEPVLQQHEQVTFEIFGDHEIYKHYRGLPRVTVLHPMSWDNYLHYTRTHRSDIALAPLLDDPFNQARSATKFFDFVRLGAAGVFSDVPPYRGLVRQQVDGVLLENRPDAWIKTLRRLIHSPDTRLQLSQAARIKAMQLAGHACSWLLLMPFV